MEYRARSGRRPIHDELDTTERASDGTDGADG